MNALRSLSDNFPFDIPTLADYEVHIPPGGKTDALVETTIAWSNGIRTRGVHPDQVMAAIEATSHLLNLLDVRCSQAVRTAKQKNRPDAPKSCS
jgi:D-citramalate synthase